MGGEGVQGFNGLKVQRFNGLKRAGVTREFDYSFQLLTIILSRVGAS
jgi:hypothetical protein